jgi:hypothetical protein
MEPVGVLNTAPVLSVLPLICFKTNQAKKSYIFNKILLRLALPVE